MKNANTRFLITLYLIFTRERPIKSVLLGRLIPSLTGPYTLHVSMYFLKKMYSINVPITKIIYCYAKSYTTNNKREMLNGVLPNAEVRLRSR